ncbi:MAG: anthranilate synthase component I [Acidimicrobiales bacterium]
MSALGTARGPKEQSPSAAGASDATTGFRFESAVVPSLADFVSLAADHSLVPVTTELIADTLTPVGAFLRVVAGRDGFLLESVEGGERWGRFSFVGRSPLATLTARGPEVAVQGTLGWEPPQGGGVLRALEALLARYRSPSIQGLPPLFSGVVGYLGYDVVREVERLASPPPDDLGFPDAGLVVIGQLCAFDHWRQRVVLIDNVPIREGSSHADLEASWADAVERLKQLATDCVRPLAEHPVAPPEQSEPVRDFTRTMSSQSYRDAVAAAKEHISSGDIFQVVLSQRYDFTLGADPFDVYRCLRLLNPSPYLYFLRLDEVTVIGSSPEPMVRLREGTVISRPIAGSRPRGSTAAEDALVGGQLAEDPKEVAEHVMLVDLARNDVGRVVQFGSEKVDELMTLERYSHIMHLTSQVSGLLCDGRGPIDVLRATLPAGTLSGAPKVRAMEIIDELEVTKRGIYGGVVGYLDFSSNLDTAIAIRTMVCSPDGRASIQAGAGIVADSDPAAEDAECAHKAAALLAALGWARELAARRYGEEA